MKSIPRLTGLMTVALLLWHASYSSTPLLAARFHNVDLTVRHENLDASPNDYSLTAVLSGRSDDDGPIDSGRLVSPTGLVFNSPIATVRRSSLSAIAELFTGTWTAFETLDGVENIYQFAVAANALDGMPTGLPIITSPRNGDTVGRTFDVRWTFDDNNLPGSVGYFTVNDPELKFTGLSVPPGAENTLRISTQLLAPAPLRIYELQIQRSHSLAAPTLTSSSPGLAGDQFDLDASFDAISTPIALNVIPEPGSLTMMVSLALCFTWRGERASSRGFSRPVANRPWPNLGY